MTDEELYAHPGWQSCTSEGAELQTLLIGLQTSFYEKLQWLDEMEEMFLFIQQKNKRTAKEKNESIGSSELMNNEQSD